MAAGHRNDGAAESSSRARRDGHGASPRVAVDTRGPGLLGGRDASSSSSSREGQQQGPWCVGPGALGGGRRCCEGRARPGAAPAAIAPAAILRFYSAAPASRHGRAFFPPWTTECVQQLSPCGTGLNRTAFPAATLLEYLEFAELQSVVTSYLQVGALSHAES